MESAREAQNEKELLWEALRKNVDKTRLIVIHLTKDDKGFGFNIRGGTDHPHIGADPGIFVTVVRADGVAGKDGRLAPGDRILAVDETRLDNVTHKEAVNVFCSTEDTVSLLVEKNAESFIQASPSKTSPDVEVGSSEEENAHSLVNSFYEFYHSRLGGLALGLTIGSLVVFVAVRVYKANK